MLTKKKYSANDIISLKLTTGEEVIAKYVEDSSTSITVDKPVCLVPQQEGLGFAPFMMTTSESRFDFSWHSIISIVPTAQELSKHYTQTTTGILV